MEPVSFPPCRHRGILVPLGLRRCYSPKLVGDKLVSPQTCHGCYCRDHPPAEPAIRVGRYRRRRGDPACGVVIGSYRWPRLIELQVRLIRRTCGPVPILVSDDCSPAGRFEAIQDVCTRYEDVTLWPNVERIGHGGGDVAACWKGLIWGQVRNLRVLAKLSQRFLLSRARWLQEGARGLLGSGRPLGTKRCRGREVFPVRSEAMLFDVERWHRPQTLHRLLPVRQRRCAEDTYAEVLREELGGEFWSWPIFSEDRYEPSRGVVWHTCNGPADYRDLAARFNLELDDDFTTDGWHVDPTYLFG